MDELDRLGWAEGLAFDFHGLKVGVRASKPGVLEGLREAFPHGSRPIRAKRVDFLYSLIVGGPGARPGVTLFHILYGGSARLTRSRNLDSIVGVLREDMELVVLGKAPRRLVLHAGAVSVGEAAILIPGQSTSGKSTLVAALLRQGATLYSDEHAVIDARGRVHPYPEPVSLRSAPDTEETKVGPEALGSRWETRPRPVKLVVLTRYKKGTRFRPHELSRARGTVEVFAHSVTAIHSPRRAMRWLVRVLDDVRIVKGTRGDADEAASRLIADVSEEGAAR